MWYRCHTDDPVLFGSNKDCRRLVPIVKQKQLVVNLKCFNLKNTLFVTHFRSIDIL